MSAFVDAEMNNKEHICFEFFFPGIQQMIQNHFKKKKKTFHSFKSSKYNLKKQKVEIDIYTNKRYLVKVFLNLLLLPQELVTNQTSMDKNSNSSKLSITRCHPPHIVHL